MWCMIWHKLWWIYTQDGHLVWAWGVLAFTFVLCCARCPWVTDVFRAVSIFNRLVPSYTIPTQNVTPDVLTTLLMWQHIATVSCILCIYPIAGNFYRGKIFHVFMESWVQRRTIFHWTWFLLLLVSKCGFLVTVPQKDPSKTWRWFHPARESIASINILHRDSQIHSVVCTHSFYLNPSPLASTTIHLKQISCVNVALLLKSRAHQCVCECY